MPRRASRREALLALSSGAAAAFAPPPGREPLAARTQPPSGDGTGAKVRERFAIEPGPCLHEHGDLRSSSSRSPRDRDPGPSGHEPELPRALRRSLHDEEACLIWWAEMASFVGASARRDRLHHRLDREHELHRERPRSRGGRRDSRDHSRTPGRSLSVDPGREAARVPAQACGFEDAGDPGRRT